MINRQYIPRDYQHAAVNYLWQAFAERSGVVNPLLVMPTGVGKASTLGMIIKDIYANWPNTGRVIVLTHVKELVDQDAKSIRWVWPNVSMSIYSSGLGEKDLSGKVIVAGIQSFVNVAHLVENPSVVLIDEAHMIPMSADTTYRKTLDILRAANPKLVCIGLTATPFRMKGGHLLDCGLFNHIACDFSSREKYVRFVKEGYLARLTTKPAKIQFDLSGVEEVAGEYNMGQLAKAVDRLELTEACCQEIMLKGADREKWLIFASSIEHAEHIADILNDKGIRTGVVHSKAKGRDDTIREFKTGNMRALVNMGVLTTGFDFPQIDLLVLMRPTKSSGLHVQMLGRGTRPVYAPGYDLTTIAGRLAAILAGSKASGCLVLDFARNIENLGPINDPVVPVSNKKKKKSGSSGSGDLPVKVCPKCESYCATRVRECEDCGYEFPMSAVDLDRQASTAEAMADECDSIVTEELAVTSVNYSLYQKPGKPASICATYSCGLMVYKQWLCFEHVGSARGMAKKWWHANIGNNTTIPPVTSVEFLGRRAELRKPAKLTVWIKKKGAPEILNQIY